MPATESEESPTRIAREAGDGLTSPRTERAPCSVCHREMPVTRLGLIRTHGPVTNRCLGSRCTPAQASDSPVHSTNGRSAPAQAPRPSDPIANVKILKRIPRAARDLAARRLGSILDDVVRENTTICWDRLFRYAVRCLRAPKRAGHRRSLATLTSQLKREETDPDPDQHPTGKHRQRHTHRSWESLAARISSKLEEGDFKGAVRLASSDDTIRELDEATLSALRDKHPAPHPDTEIPPLLSTSQIPPLQVSADEVSKAIRSFPCASAAGPDGLRPQHLKDMIGAAAGEGGNILLQALTRFVNLVLEGKVTPPARHFFFGATLLALGKKDGGVRPIAVGCTLRRLVAKCACNSVKRAMAALLAPHQLGFGVPLGAEAAVHASRVYLQDMPDHHLLLKLDFRNAFNSLRRDKMLMAVRENAPQLFPLVHSAYSAPSSLFAQDATIQSAEGVQQGDLLGPLLFSLATMGLMKPLRSELVIFYLDDGTLGGGVEDVLHDLQTVAEEAARLGLQLNHSKSEVICNDPSVRAAMINAFPDLCPVNPENAHLLGSPIGGEEGIDSSISEKVRALEIMGNRLCHLQTHDAYCLLRHSCAIPKLLYTLRTSPCSRSSHLQRFDALLRSLLGEIVNINIADDDAAWTQASLPVGSGGLGVRSATQLAPSAFLASAAGCTTIVLELLPPRLRETAYYAREDTLQVWSEGLEASAPLAADTPSQKAWDAPRVAASLKALQAAAPDSVTQARLLALPILMLL